MLIHRLLLFSLSCYFVQGWDTDGHSAIGMTVMSGIKGDALAQLKRLLQGKDVVDVASWTSSVVKKYPAMETIFFQPQEKDLSKRVNCTSFNANDPCPKGRCLVNSAKFFYTHLIGRVDLSPDFQMPVNLKFTDTDNMKFLIAVVAEMHAPMKFGYTENNLGRDTEIQFADAGKVKQTTLYDYWDHELVQKTIRDRPNFWYSGWTHQNNLGRAFYDRELSAWNKATAEERLEILEQWAAETFQSMCSRVQRKQLTGPADDGEQSDERSLLVPDKFAYTAAHIFMDFEFLKTKILTAGIRNSIVLNSILASRDAKRLRQGSGVKVPLHKVQTVQTAADPHTWARMTRNLGINLVIIGLVVGIFLMFVKYTSGVTQKQPREPVAIIRKEKT